MVSPAGVSGGDDSDDSDETEETETPTEPDPTDEETEDLDDIEGGAEIATADVHDENIEVEDEEVGGVRDSSSTSLEDAEIDIDEDDLDVETADVEGEDIKSESGKFGFEDTEDAEDDGEKDEESDDEDDEGGLGSLDDLDKGGQMAADINNGVASLGVVGIEDDERQEELREDFYETARQFRLGYYGEECVNEYFLSEDDGDMSPVWGLVFASLVCGVVFALKRPDTEELGGKVSDAVDRIGGGLGGDD